MMTGSVSSGGSTGTVRTGPVRRMLDNFRSRRSGMRGYGCTGTEVSSYGSSGSTVAVPVVVDVTVRSYDVHSVSGSFDRPVSFHTDNSTLAFASSLNSSGRLYHDSSYNGAEVVYRSSGIATEAAARASWMRSPGHRRLLLAGKISNVVCVGNVCVGR